MDWFLYDNGVRLERVNVPIILRFVSVRNQTFTVNAYTFEFFINIPQKQPPRGVVSKRCSENMLQSYRTLMPMGVLL